jgi:hypothetical protein
VTERAISSWFSKVVALPVRIRAFRLSWKECRRDIVSIHCLESLSRMMGRFTSVVLWSCTRRTGAHTPVVDGLLGLFTPETPSPLLWNLLEKTMVLF